MAKRKAKASALETIDAARAAEQTLTQAVEHAKRLKARSRAAKGKAKEAKKTAKQAAKAARAARKAADEARRVYKKAFARAAKVREKAAKQDRGQEKIATPRSPSRTHAAAGTRRRSR